MKTKSKTSFSDDLLILTWSRSPRGKACAWKYRRQSKRKPRATPTDCIVIDMGCEVPTVIAAYHCASYPFFARFLPEQFIDHAGNLRNKQGRIVFAKEEKTNAALIDIDGDPMMRIQPPRIYDGDFGSYEVTPSEFIKAAAKLPKVTLTEEMFENAMKELSEPQKPTQ